MILTALLLLASVTPASDIASNGALEAHLIVTNEGAALLEQWAAGAPRIKLRSIDAAERGQFVTAIVRFGGCKPNSAGMCNATVDYVAQRPDGSTYGEMKAAELWVNKPAPNAGGSQLAVQYLGLVFEPNDPAGEYKITATVHDHEAATSVSVSRALSLP